MNFEEKVLGMLDQIMNKQDEHSRILDEHSRILNEHSMKLDEHSLRLDEHSQVLTALRAGQEYLGAEIEGMKLSNVKEFGSINKQLDEFTINFGILRDESWKSKTEIQRIKNTMGM